MSTEQIYAAPHFGGHLSWGSHPAVLVVDLTYGFTDTACSLGADLDEVVASTVRLLTAARQTGVPVCFTRIAFDDEQLSSTIWIQKSPALAELRPGSRAAEIDARLGRRPDEIVITKQSPSAVFRTDLESVLSSWRTDTVVLVGATTSGCVRATAVDLMQLGIPTVVPEACVGDRAPDAHRASMLDLQAKYADVVELDDAIAYLQRCPSPGAEGEAV